MKKIILFIILLINFPLVYGNGYAIIHDPDGYVNLRKREDGEPVSSIYRFSNISLKLGNKLLTVPQADLSQAFIPEYSINSGEIFQNLNAYISPKDNHAYIFSLLADGAGLYTIVFEFRNNKYYKRYIWLETI